MNPRIHDEFVALCALFYSGEISEEDWALLQVHLAYCDSCRRSFDEFKIITSNTVPEMALAASEELFIPSESATAFEDAHGRLMRQLDAHSKGSTTRSHRRSSLLVYGGALAAYALVIATIAGVKLFRHDASQRRDAGVTIQGLSGSTKQLSPSPSVAAPPEPKREELDLANLRERYDLLEKSAKRSDSTVDALRQRLLAEQGERQEIVGGKDALSQQLATAQSDIQALREQLTTARTNTEQQTAQIASLETKISLLGAEVEDANNTLNSKDRMLALDKDFLAHDRDIRDLIGARNLYIADIYDTTESGKTAKPFGRIFYTQDRSLVFYGFDLEKQSGISRPVTFQAWGSGSDRHPVSLGLFYQDDGHKRWVVRCDDAKTLARLNMVFVTVEPPGGSNKPTGKQLLRAYLQIQPNHP